MDGIFASVPAGAPGFSLILRLSAIGVAPGKFPEESLQLRRGVAGRIVWEMLREPEPYENAWFGAHSFLAGLGQLEGLRPPLKDATVRCGGAYS